MEKINAHILKKEFFYDKKTHGNIQDCYFDSDADKILIINFKKKFLIIKEGKKEIRIDGDLFLSLHNVLST